MYSPGSQTGVQSLETCNSSHCSVLQPRETTTPLVHPYSPPASPVDHSQRSSLFVNGPSPRSAVESRAGYRKRQKHVPIVITGGVINAVLKDQKPAEIAGPPLGTLETFKLAALKYNADSLPRSFPKPRHIPIVIPDYVNPFDPLSPIHSGNNTPQFSTSPVLASPPPKPFKMSLNADSQTYQPERNNSQTSLNKENGQEDSTSTVTVQPATTNVAAYMQQSQPGTTSLSGLVCNVHKCTGSPPHALVGATTTVLGDKLYVFGGRRLSRRRPQLTADLFELDLVRRHWTKVEATGSVPPPRYFHSVCALGDNKLICYGGMSPATSQTQSQGSQQQAEQQPEVVVMSDIHIYDTNTRVWTHIPIPDNPQGRYAHCATVLPSSAVFSSSNAPLSAIHNNPSSANPNQGSIGVALDGAGGAEMVVVGGQDSGNTYIDQISVFNLRSLKWTATSSFSRSCGAYRSVVAPLTSISPSAIGASLSKEESKKNKNDPSSMLIYSNYNFLDVKLDLQIRLPDGSLVEKPMSGQFSPPGLRFPNGGVLNEHFVVSGTYLTSSRQEYALWALDLRTLTWSRIDSGGSIFSQGSWNRGVLWPRRNTFVILGDRKRALVDDYNHRRLNFTNICLVELEAFGLYDNPRHASPCSAYSSSSAPMLPPNLQPKMSLWSGGGRPHFAAAEDLGKMVLGIKEISDMDILTINGERIPVNSHFLARRWGPYFVHLLREGSSAPNNGADGTDSATLKATTMSGASRNSSITITPTVNTTYSSSTLTGGSTTTAESDGKTFYPPTSANLTSHSRSRTLYLPHTTLTIQALLHFLYTSSLPPITHSLSTPQILCSLLQLARPYRIDGLLEAVVERLHQDKDGRNAAAVFNASAMAAGGGRGTGFDHFGTVQLIEEMLNGDSDTADGRNGTNSSSGFRIPSRSNGSRVRDAANGTSGNAEDSEDDNSDADGTGSVASADDTGDANGGAGARASGVRAPDEEEEMWNAERSCVIGLQKRGLRGLMEGRRMRERGRSAGGTQQNGSQSQQGSASAPGAGAPLGAPASSSQGPVEVSG